MRINQLARIFPWIFILYTLHITLYTNEAFCASKGNSPVAYWRFDEGGGGTAYDSVGSNNGTLNAGAGGTNTAVGQMWTRQGKIGGALELDGTDDYVDIPDVDSIDFTVGTVFTLEAWIRPNSLHNGAIITKGIANQHFNYQFGIRSNGALWITNTAAEYTTTTTPVIAQTWQHVVSVWNNGTVSIYCNGSFVQNLSCNNSGGNALALRIGNRGGAEYFSGFIDDVRIYNYARTADQIFVDYNAGSAAYLGVGADPNEGNPPVGYWTMDERTGTIAYDKSGNGNNGTLTNGPVWITGKIGNALQFDGTNDYVLVADSPSLSALPGLTLEMWFNPNSGVTSSKNIIMKDYSQWEYCIEYYSEGVDFYLNNGYRGRFTGVRADQWNFFAATYDKQNIVIYLNGVKKTTIAYTADIIDSPGNLYIGSYSYAGKFFPGKIDEVKIYNYARTQTQITYDYNKGKPVAHYKFDEGGGAIAHDEYSSADTGIAPAGLWRMDNNWADSSGNANTGTANGGATFSASSKIGPYCGAFDGTDDYVNAGNMASLNIANAVTVSAWVKASYSSSIIGGVAVKGTDLTNLSSTKGYALRLAPSPISQVEFIISDDYKFVRTKADYPNNTWFHVAGTNDGTTSKLYINGILVNSADSSSLVDINSSDSLLFGKENATLYEYVNNGDFEVGTTAGWSKTDADAVMSIVNDERTGGEGSKCFNITSGTANTWIATPGSIKTVAGTAYTMSGWIKSIDGADVGFTAARPVTYAILGSANSSSTSWTYKTFTFTAQDSTTLIYITSPFSKTSRYDDISVTRQSAYTNYLNGLVDDVRVYSYARTADQIYNDYKATHGTLVGDTKFVDGKIGKALQFDGAGDRVISPDDDFLDMGTGNFTYSCWIKTNTGDSNWHYIMGKADTSSPYTGAYFYIKDGKTYNYFNTTTTNSLGAGTITVSDNAWHHIANVYNRSGNLTVYVDGKVDNTFSISSYNTSVSNSGFFKIGGTEFNQDFNGLIDEVRVYSYSRTAEQVMQDYNEGKSVRLGSQAVGVADPWGGALPAAYWKLDENTGVLAQDASGNGNNGTLINGPTWTQGKVGPCLSFDGANDYLTISNGSSLFSGKSAVTVSFWVKHNNSNPLESIINIPTGSGGIFSIENNSAASPALVYFNNNNPASVALTAGEWTHIVAVFDNGAVKGYKNGSLVSSTTNTSSAIGATTGNLEFGKMNWVSGFTNMNLDDVKIYNYARTSAQIAWDYNRGKPVAQWRFDEKTDGQTVDLTAGAIKDDSDNNNDGAASNTTWATYATGKFGSCLSFDGNDYINVTNRSLSIQNSISISTWVKNTDTSFSDGYANYIISKGIQGGPYWNDYVLTLRPDYKYSFFIYTSQGSYSVITTSAFNDSNWHHVEGIYDYENTTIKIYVDGKLESSVLAQGTIRNAAGTFYIGDWNGSSGWHYWRGFIDDVCIYNYARTAEQIMQDYNQGMAVKMGE